MSSLENKIKKALKGPQKNAAFLARYIGAVGHEAREKDEQSTLQYWGHSVGSHRAIGKILGEDSGTTPDERWKNWLAVWKASPIFDVKSIVLNEMSAKKLREFRRSKWKDMVAMADDIDNWAHSDTLSGMIAEVLEAEPAKLSQHKKWNKSKNPWLRRQSLVGIYCYARMRKKHIPARDALALVEALLDDPHFYVQRGVGWTLREIDRVDAGLQRKFVRKHLDRISGVAWFATSELYGAALRKELVEARKKGRSKK